MDDIPIDRPAVTSGDEGHPHLRPALRGRRRAAAGRVGPQHHRRSAAVPGMPGISATGLGVKEVEERHGVFFYGFLVSKISVDHG